MIRVSELSLFRTRRDSGVTDLFIPKVDTVRNLNGSDCGEPRFSLNPGREICNVECVMGVIRMKYLSYIPHRQSAYYCILPINPSTTT